MLITLNDRPMTRVRPDRYLGFGSEVRIAGNKIVQVKYGDTRYTFRAVKTSSENETESSFSDNNSDVIIGPLASISTRDGIVFHFEGNKIDRIHYGGVVYRLNDGMYRAKGRILEWQPQWSLNGIPVTGQLKCIENVYFWQTFAGRETYTRLVDKVVDYDDARVYYADSSLVHIERKHSLISFNIDDQTLIISPCNLIGYLMPEITVKIGRILSNSI